MAQKKTTKMLILEGYLRIGLDNYVIIEDDQGRSILLDDTLVRSLFLGEEVRLTVSRKMEG